MPYNDLAHSLSGTRELRLTYRGSKDLDKSQLRFVGWSDADYANDPRDRLEL